jgi:hypothetical protein
MCWWGRRWVDDEGLVPGKAENRRSIVAAACRDFLRDFQNIPIQHVSPEPSPLQYMHRRLYLAIKKGDGNDCPSTVDNPVTLPNSRERCIRPQCQPHPQQPRARSRGPGQQSSS